ncbi:MAG: hypothetical protein AN484_26180 [Aphanizomenon flos-aquae WA102]|uniref:Peptidase A2 domain-containing protein n=1 Tax=Aphanizomenon flos-aquae WA102 TaxID=1710896 RepID=A0A1B7WEK7_APHFL|nr:MAG: hypothetical protein AN484_26180 [Aphanizomenon flos-aquae WA102]
MSDHVNGVHVIAELLLKLPEEEKRLWTTRRTNVAVGREAVLWPGFVRERLDTANLQASRVMAEEARRGSRTEAGAKEEKRKSSPASGRGRSKSPGKARSPRRSNVNAARADRKDTPRRRNGGRCIIEGCRCEFYLKDCPRFREADAESRLRLAEDQGLCRRCLGHPARQICHARGNFCNVLETCRDKPHHILLHEGMSEARYLKIEVRPMRPAPEVRRFHLTQEVRTDNGCRGTLIFDSGASDSLVTRAFARRANLKRIGDCRRTVQNFGGQSLQCSGIYSLEIRGEGGKMTSVAVKAVPDLGDLPEVKCPRWIEEVLPGTRGLWSDLDQPGGRVDLVLGVDEIVSHPELLRKVGGLCLFQSAFGGRRILAGTLPPRPEAELEPLTRTAQLCKYAAEPEIRG